MRTLVLNVCKKIKVYFILRYLTSILEKIGFYREIEFHRNIADRQRNSYNSNRKDSLLLNNALLIEVDFKGKIKLGNFKTGANLLF